LSDEQQVFSWEGNVWYKLNVDLMCLHYISNIKLHDNILKRFLYIICVSHGSVNEDCGPLGYEAMSSGRWLGTVLKNLLALFSMRLKVEAVG
jgi:hypothetical protein